MISVFNYTDYRNFLLDYYNDRKRLNRRFTYRLFCQLAGIKSPGHLKLIIEGEANISPKLARQFCAAMAFNKRSSEYFVNLVLFNQAKSHDAAKVPLEKMLSLGELSVRLVDADRYEYYKTWYHSVIRALVEFVNIKDDYDLLAKTIEPSISPTQARRSVELMLKLGLIVRTTDGFLRPAQAVIDTGLQGGSTAITNYGLATLDLARRAIGELSEKQRKFSWVTVGVSSKGYGEILDKIREFRSDVARIAAADTADRVYQVNIQLFPLSKPQASMEV